MHNCLIKQLNLLFLKKETVEEVKRSYFNGNIAARGRGGKLPVDLSASSIRPGVVGEILGALGVFHLSGLVAAFDAPFHHL